MRKPRVLPLLVAAAVAIGLYAIPAVASASVWTKAGIPMPEQNTIGFSGKASWHFNGQGYECDVNGKAVLTPGDKGEITEYKIQPSTCIGFGANWQGCEVTNASATTPWPIQAVEEGGKKLIRLSKFAYTLQLQAKPGKACSRSSWSVLGINITATPNNPSAISSLLLGGTVNAGGIPSGIGNWLSVSSGGWSYGIS